MINLERIILLIIYPLIQNVLILYTILKYWKVKQITNEYKGDIKDIKFVETKIKEIESRKQLLKILLLNIRSIRKNFEELFFFLETYNFRSVEVIVLIECCQFVSISHSNIARYVSIYNESKINQNDRVVFHLKSHIHFSFSNTKLTQTNATENTIYLI